MSYIHSQAQNERAYIKMADEKVVAVHLGDEGKNTFFDAHTNTFREHSECIGGTVGRKEDLFDKVCELPNWDEICGRVVFLNPTELQELLAD